MWATSFWLGDLGAAEHHIERGIGLYDPGAHRSLAFLYGGHDPACAAASFRYGPSGCGGARSGPGVHGRGDGPGGAARASGVDGPGHGVDVRPVPLRAERPRDGASGAAPDRSRRRVGPCPVAGWGLVFEGWSRAQLGDVSAGIAEIQEGLIGAKTPGRPHAAGAPVPARAGGRLPGARPDRGRHPSDRRRFGDDRRRWRTGLARRAVSGSRGSCSRRAGPPSLRRPMPVREALATARATGGFRVGAAGGHESRPAARSGGRRDAARQTVGEVYARFTEGLDTPDLADARALLAEP